MSQKMNSTNKHAYLLLVHGNPYVLEKLILLLDDERSDIYIHVDRKVKDFDFGYFSQLAKKSKLVFIDRVNVYWGHVSQIEAELKLFRAAFEQDSYAYYHLMSGSDLPLKTQDEIHDFFKKKNGIEFIGYSNDKLDIEKVENIHLFPKYQRLEEKELLKRLARKIRKVFLSIQRKINYRKRLADQVSFKQGANWVSLTHDLVAELLRREGDFLRFYRHSSCADEIYKHTFVYNSVFKEKVFSLDDELKSCQRFMDWKRGRPYTFRKEDFDLIMSSDFLFARKFEDKVDKDIVDAIFRRISQGQHSHTS